MKRRPLEALFAGTGGAAFPRMTALVGAGGKTTLMYALARRCRAACGLYHHDQDFPAGKRPSRGSLGGGG